MAVPHLEDPIHPLRQIQIVGGDERTDARAADEAHQKVEHVFRGMLIEIAGRLVGQEELRRVGECPRNRYALLLSTRELAGTMASPPLQPSPEERGVG